MHINSLKNLFFPSHSPRTSGPADAAPPESSKPEAPADSVQWNGTRPGVDQAPRPDDGPGAGGGYDEDAGPDSDGPGAGGGHDQEPGPDSDGPGAGGGYDALLPSLTFAPIKPMLYWQGPTMALMAFEDGPGVGGGYGPVPPSVDGVEDQVKEGGR